jgi:hypothetical protein
LSGAGNFHTQRNAIVLQGKRADEGRDQDPAADDQALFIEEELERWLRVEDRPVGGEMRVQS